MFKHRDVLADPTLGKGDRLPKQFHEQVLRCASDTGLNVFATINNRFIIDGLPAREHGMLELEFLSDSTRTKLSRIRARRGREEPSSVLFTRVGALITLKAMLALGSRDAFTRTAVGACALHANDYAESDDTSSLSSGILSVVAEFAPVRDLQNPPEAGPLFRRFGYIYQKLLTQHAEMRQLIRDELHCEVEELTFSGLPFDKYFSILFGIYAVTLAAAKRKPYPTSIFDLRDIAEKVQIHERDLLNFVRERSMTEIEARKQIGPITNAEGFAVVATDSRWATDFRVFRNRPLLELRDGRFMVLDLQFLHESASRGLYWSLFHRLSDEAKRRFAAAWGDLFETYVLDLVRHYFPDLRGNEDVAGREVDGVLELGGATFLIEVKSGFLPEAAKGSRNQSTFAEAVERKFVKNEKGKPKGVGQLAATLESIRGGSGLLHDQPIYSILVGEDPVLASFAMNTYLDDIFLKATPHRRTDDRLAVMLIDELEHILPYLSHGDIDLKELLDGRIVLGKMSPEHVASTFNTMAVRRGVKVREETFLSKQGEELTAMLDRAFEGLSD
ncbi:MAG TPA: hypothetical protein VHW00_13030 [Thermoanaerobaculia bacterium]|nr:hypothetical protein [Thermoanaerobaculia bacterium]